jgi:hypothetical protein
MITELTEIVYNVDFKKVYNMMSPVQKRGVFSILIIFLSVVVVCVLLLWLIPLLSAKLVKLPTNEIITSLTVIVSIIAIAITLVKDALNYEYTTKHTIQLNAVVNGNIVTFTCLFKNESRNRIYPRNFYLLIDRSHDQEHFEFDNILRHEEGTLDCELGKICKADKVLTEYPDIYDPKHKSVSRKFYHLKHISPNSVSFIDPGEVFTEDITMKFDAGVYRAIVVGTSRNHDCVCANIQFVVQSQEVTGNNPANADNGVK